MKEKQLYSFLVKALGLYVIWSLIYHGYVEPDGRFNQLVTLNIAQVSAGIMGLFGYSARGFELAKFVNIIEVEGRQLVQIEAGCNGVVLMALFTGFIIAFPGKWKDKMWFIPTGLVIIYALNIIRCVALTFIVMYRKGAFELNHKYTFTITLYTCIFMLWMWWVNNYSPVSPKWRKENEGGDTPPSPELTPAT